MPLAGQPVAEEHLPLTREKEPGGDGGRLPLRPRVAADGRQRPIVARRQSSGKGVVDLETGSARLINKVRPLVKDGGKLVVVNNALFLSGADFVHGLEELGRGGFLSIDETIPIPEDFTGYPETRVGRPPADPAPFNHSTKIVVLTVRQKGKTDDRQ